MFVSAHPKTLVEARHDIHSCIATAPSSNCLREPKTSFNHTLAVSQQLCCQSAAAKRCSRSGWVGIWSPWGRGWERFYCTALSTRNFQHDMPQQRSSQSRCGHSRFGREGHLPVDGGGGGNAAVQCSTHIKHDARGIAAAGMLAAHSTSPRVHCALHTGKTNA
jgi:hypothetical protein